VKRLLDRQKELEKEIAKLRGELEKDRIPDLISQKQVISGANVLIAQLDGVDGKQLREIADQLKDKLGSGIVVLASASDGNVNLVASVSKEMTKKFHAGNIVKELAGMVGGGGGGRPDFAQAGGKEPAKIAAALKRAEEIVKQAS
jgi:alanyl-tRNA synthetase